MATSTHRPALTACLLAGLTALLAEAPAGAATITVATTVDASAVACTLRDAITAANTDAPSGACPAGAGNDTLDLTGLGGSILLATPLPELTSNVHVRGPGAANLSIDGQGAVQLFFMRAATVTVTDVTIARGLAARGGGIWMLGGTVTLTRVVVTLCRAFNGGGIANDAGGTLTIVDSTIAANTTTGNSGAGIVSDASTLVLTNTTVSGNTNTGLNREGAGLLLAEGTATIRNCTFSNNVGTSADGWAISNFSPAPGLIGTIHLANTIIANSAGHNCVGPIISDGHNLSDDNTCGPAGPGDFHGGPAGLAGLADNGGPTPTHALMAGSDAIDFGDPALCPRTDQRGVERPVDGNGDGVAVCDRGAFEIGCGEGLSTGTPCAPDPNPCTDDVCDGTGTCVHPSNTAPCEDGNPCTIGDTCAAGVCATGTPVTCPLIGGLTYQTCLSTEIESGPTGTNACTQIGSPTASGFNSGLDNLRSIAESPDGRSLYVVSGFDDAVARFDRDAATGALTYQGCLTGKIEATMACTGIGAATADGGNSGLDGLQSVALSADGKSLYAASIGDDAVARFDRDPATGALTYQGCISGEAETGPTGTSACTQIGSATASGANSGLDGLRSVTLSGDGKSLYSISAEDDAVVRFDRDPATGALTYQGCLSGEAETGPTGTNACTQIGSATASGADSGLDNLFALALSADGISLYAVSQFDDAVVRFDRDPATGALTYRGCISGEAETGPTGTNACAQIDSASPSGMESGLDSLFTLALSADGISLYAVSQDDDAVARFDRDPATGALAYRGCTTGELESGAPTPVPGSGACAEIRSAASRGTSSGLDKPRAVAVSPDGRSLYVLSPQDDAVVHFVRDPATGAVTHQGCLTGETETGPAGTDACVAIGSARPLGTNSGLDNPQALVVDADGRSLYTASGNDAAVAHFAREPEPTITTQPISGKALLILDPADTKRRIVFTSRDPRIDTAAGSGIDPVADGAVLQVFNTSGTGDSACFDLPAAGWKAKGKPLKRTLRYKDKRFVRGPCRAVMVKDAKLLEVVCQATRKPIDYSLDEPAQGSVGVRFRSGTTEYCTVFGGTVTKDRQHKTFKARNAPAPAACPEPPACTQGGER